MPSSRCVHSTSISLSPSPLSLSLSHSLTLFLPLISLVSPRFEEQALQEGEAAAAEPAAAEGGEQPAGTGKELVKSVTEAITEKPTEANSHYIKGYNDKVCVFDSMPFSSPTDWWMKYHSPNLSTPTPTPTPTLNPSRNVHPLPTHLDPKLSTLESEHLTP